MSDRVLVVLGKGGGGLAVIMGLAGLTVLVATQPLADVFEIFAPHNAVLAVGWGAVVWVVIASQPRNGAVWALAGAALAAGIFVVCGAGGLVVSESQGFDVIRDVDMLTPADMPFWTYAWFWPTSWVWVVAFFLPLTVGLLLFPDGTLPSPRWRPVVWVALGSLLAVSAAFASAAMPDSTLPLNADVTEYRGFARTVELWFYVLAATAVLCIAGFLLRYRRAPRDVRSQIRWVAWACSALIVVIVVSIPFSELNETSRWDYLILAGVILVPISFGVAIMKYRLYDIDLVISRTVTYGALAVFIASLYAVVVVGVGSLLGRGDEPDVLLSIGATALIAVLFEPIHRRVRRWADRLVYGERSTPYGVLSAMTARLAEAGAAAGALDGLPELVARGTGAEAAAVSLQVGNELRPVATWPPSEMPHADPSLAVPVLEAGETLGTLAIHKGRTNPVTDGDRRLLEDVAAGAGLLLRNMRLNAELAERADQLRASRRRLVAAQDAERHRLERDLHDGAQQQVVALKVKLGLAKALAAREGADRVAELVGSLSADADEAVDAMRAVARGIYPPLLEAEGLAAALATAQRAARIPVEIEANGTRRYPRHVEETAYFCVLEAIEAATMAGAHGARVAVAELADGLLVEVDHDGRAVEADLAAVADRVDAFGGSMAVEVLPGSGTRVTSRIPVGDDALEPA